MNPPTNPQFEDALAFAEQQARRIIAAYPGYYPMYTVAGKWNREGERWTHWCEGFFPGILWLLHKHTNDPWLREQAERYTRPLEPRKLDRNVHDLGFIFFSTYLRWYHLTNEPALRDVLIQAGRTLALRYQPKGKFLASFIGPQSLFIDIMMNVGLIFWAARETGDEELYRIAYNHCQTTRQYLVRGGGTAHEGIFDADTGRFLRHSTHQGWNAESTWARGQAWGLYGFTAVYRLTGEPAFLTTAWSCANDYVYRLPLGGFPPGRDMTKVPEEFHEYCREKQHVPYWDFDLPQDAPHLWDSSAAAIAASGLLDLAEVVGDPERAKKYHSEALSTLATLCSPEFLAKDDPEWEGILKHGVYHFHKNLGVDESVAWGEHFFVEALVKAVHGRSDAAW